MKNKSIKLTVPSLWYCEVNCILRILYPDGKVEMLSMLPYNENKWDHSHFSEDTAKEALTDLQKEHEFVSYL